MFVVARNAYPRLAALVVVAALFGVTAPPVTAKTKASSGFAGVSASSVDRGAGASRAADGRLATAWYARRAGAWSWRGRLARTAALDRVRIRAARSMGRVRISVSSDGRRYRHVRTVALRRGTWRAVSLAGRRARFVRISGRTKRGRGGGLAEVVVRVRPTRPGPLVVVAAAGLPGIPPSPLTFPPTAADPPAANPPPPPRVDPEPGCQPRPRTADPPDPGAELQPPALPAQPGLAPPTPSGGTPFAGVVERPIDENHLRWLPFRTRSHWLQPWRAYLDTPPARRLRDAVGINFNADQGDVDAVAELLAANGFRRARIEIPWGDYAYEDPTRLIHRERFEQALCAVRDAGLRPLILLNSNDQRPVPSFGLELEVQEEVKNGADQVTLTEESAKKVIPQYTGFDWRFGAEALITEMKPGNVAVLSKSLDLPPEEGDRVIAPKGGTMQATVLKYLPFSPPRFDSEVEGEPGDLNPFSEETMLGWLDYVETTTSLVREMLGTTAFDIEISNELNLNAAFWDVNNYFDEPPFAQGLPDQAIVNRTVAQIRDPASDLAGVRITNGFASQRPWDSGATSPAGLDALSKHYYPRNLRFPDVLTPPSTDSLRFSQPVDAKGSRTGTRDDGSDPWVDPFMPVYDTFFPEFWLTGIATETIVRDLAPWPESFDFRGPPTPPTEHGRSIAAPDGRVPEFWMTEIGLETGWAEDGLGLTLSEDDTAHIRAKAALRTLVSFVHKGMTQIDFYAAAGEEWGLIGGDFWRLLRETGDYPGDGTGGPVMDGMRRLVSTFGDQDVTTARSLTLASIGDYGGRTQFAGDGSEDHPDLHDRDVLAFFPFQASDRRFVIPVYVMTRNLARVYDGAPGPERFDLPEERYQLTIGGIDTEHVRVSAVDPLTGDTVPVDVVRTDDEWLVVELPVTDSPRLLILDDTPAAPELP